MAAEKLDKSKRHDIGYFSSKLQIVEKRKKQNKTRDMNTTM